MFDAIYRDARGRVAELAGSLSDEQLDSRIAGSPEWTGHQVVSHLVGVAADIGSGNMDGAPGPAWTAAQVDARRGVPLATLLAEWDATGPGVEVALAERRVGAATILDALTHEADLREQFGLGRPPIEHIEAAALSTSRGVVGRFDGPAVLVVRCTAADGTEHEWTGGAGERRAVLTLDSYELFRGLISRRSRRQMLAWQWEGDADPAQIVERLPVFGPRDDDQPTPA